MKSNYFETHAIHAGYDDREHSGSLSPPIFQTSTFVFPDAETGERRFAGTEEGYVYSRLKNPTVRQFEERMAVLEGGEKALAFASGMAAVSAVLLGLAKTGEHILCSEGVYGCTYGLLQFMEERLGISHSFLSMESAEELDAGILSNTSLIYIESPINPTMKLVDLEMVVTIAKEKGIPVIVDNTFCSPYLQRPLELGCDLVVHSATKYLCGHGDVIGGVAVGRQEVMEQIAHAAQKDIGGIMSPFDAWLLLRGIKTLPVRMDRHCDNAEHIAVLLKRHPYVDGIFYPGDPDFPQYDIACKQMKKSGGMISFRIKGGKEEAQQLVNELQLIKIAVSLGDAETLIQHPATMTHSGVPEHERENMGIPQNLLRLSVGLEAWQDIWADLEQALHSLMQKEDQVVS
ncbi:methionine gamma-lyase [Fictibacillus enclensis]|uniref:methionine gamma-lyase n=1 Tax=Fictibacillus enclensis TaxID=1017270 RepID=UPI0025A061F2|nr:methionine gamma-lyase [Fictibacillus enclensis]MDM5339407.1 methionine gamma-lyase [Fictibacillus enclensis]